MNAAKYVLATSLAWVALLGAAAFFYFERHPELQGRTAAGPSAPVAAAPAARGALEAPMQGMEQRLAAVHLTAEQMQGIGMTTGTAELKDLSDDLRATGLVAVNDRLVSYVQVRFAGYLRKVYVDAPYEYVKKGDPLFTIYSPDLVATEQELLLANENQRALASSTIRGVAAGARLLSSAAERRLEQWEIPESEIAKLKATGKALNELTINSPASGYVTERNAYPNLYAEPATRLYAITDLSRVWVNAQVFQQDVGRLKAGDAAAITVDAYPQKIFSGRVEEILPQVEQATRTVQVRLLVENAGILLKPGMFVNVDLKSSLGRRLAVPASAVMDTGMKQVVFLNKGGGAIEPREVVLGPQVGDQVVVLKGLEPHQAIVTSANFLIDSESQLQAEAGGPMEPAAGAKTSAAQIEFLSHPDPPHMGTNLLQVKVTAGGAAVTGADVAVRFFMPAMPEMGMAAMSASAQLAEKTPGLYEGSVELSMGGTWQVTVSATKQGQAVATKKFSVNAKGGM